MDRVMKVDGPFLWPEEVNNDYLRTILLLG